MNENDELHDLVVDATTYRTRLTRKYRERKPVVLPDPRRILAHIPGLVTEVSVEPGAAVARGDRVLVLEAMKMQNAITVAIDGTVASVHVETGQLVAKGDLLLELSR